jgi:prepilin-type N-terminal cleavage/methylation domain-containing protein
MTAQVLPHSPNDPRSSQAGFTLIELLITIAIMVLLLGGGLASYLRIDRRQSLINVCSQVALMARTAQKKARVGDRPEGCLRLDSYSVSRTATGPDVISLQAVCSNDTYTTEEYEVPTVFTVQSLTTMSFRVLHGGLEGANGVVRVRSTFPNYQCEFLIDGGGSISTTSVTQY